MLTLDLPTGPYWLDLPRGVRVEIKPVTTAVMAAAQAAASRRLGAAKAEYELCSSALAKTPIAGSSGVEAAFHYGAAYNAAAGRVMTITPKNQQTAAEYA